MYLHVHIYQNTYIYIYIYWLYPVRLTLGTALGLGLHCLPNLPARGLEDQGAGLQEALHVEVGLPDRGFLVGIHSVAPVPGQ